MADKTTIVISFSAPHPIPVKSAAEICAVYYPNNAAADLPVFEGTYYDTNVEGFGEGMSLETFMARSVAYPKLNAYLREAIRTTRYEFSTFDENLVLYLKECAPALKAQGFTFEFIDS